MDRNNSTRKNLLIQRAVYHSSLCPGLYALDPERAAERLFAGRCLGTCKDCGLEFRVPASIREWPAFFEGMLRHPLVHDRSEGTKLRVDEMLASLWDVSPETADAARSELAGILGNHLDDLISASVLVRVRGDG